VEAEETGGGAMNQKNLTVPMVLPGPIRCKSNAPLGLSDLSRPVRIRKSGRPHQQIWLRPNAADYAGRLKVRAAATLDELMCDVTRASLSPSHYSFLHRPNRFDFSRATLKARDLFDRFRPHFILPMKRIATAATTVITLAYVSNHRLESFW
jgi:hypothetical protein